MKLPNGFGTVYKMQGNRPVHVLPLSGILITR
nr:MAG TPA: hypothetical protein [Caudoviricetes sp.]